MLWPIHPSISIIDYGTAARFPFLVWGWQHQAMSITSSPFISVKWVNASLATLIDISLHTFRPCLSGPSFLSSAWNLKVCDRFDKGHGSLYIAMPSESLRVKD